MISKVTSFAEFARNFRQRYLLPAISNNLIEMTQADKPNSPTQKGK
jgi:hypothetical protein